MKIVKLVSIIILSFCATVGYSQKVAKQEAKKVIKEIPLSHPYSKEYVDECIKEMLETGDSYCYEIYFLHSKQNMLYDLLMADKYNNPWACYEVYHNIAKGLGEEYKYIISKELWNLAFYYLKKGADLNDENCISELVRIYEKGNTYVAADSLKADYYREKEKNYYRENQGETFVTRQFDTKEQKNSARTAKAIVGGACAAVDVNSVYKGIKAADDISTIGVGVSVLDGVVSGVGVKSSIESRED